MVWAMRADGLLSCPFALPVHIDSAVGCIEFRIGLLRVTAENIVRGHGYEPNALPVTGGGHIG